mmetsp:Transcript_41461/g.87908  ORF Transcript_41461/g.87908 Transcript_41461/m.87908 type:complete len:529 (+) Transcript_41461:47-1633(+)
MDKAGDASVSPGRKRTELEADISYDAGQMGKVLDTPRTKEACKRTGITLKELQIKAFQDFYQVGDMVGKQRLRFNHYETRRQEKLNLVLAERAKIISKEGDQQETASKSYGSLAVMEQLLNKEAKRLEKELRNQLRFHATVEKENEEQLDREAHLRERERFREGRRQARKKQYEASAQQIKNVLEAKAGKAAMKLESQQHEFESKLMEYMHAMLEEDIRLADLAEEKAKQNNDKAEAWRKKLELQEKRREAVDLKRELEGQELLARYSEKLEHLEQYRQEEDEKRGLRFEEQQLRIMDAQEKAGRIARQEQHRRTEVAEALEVAQDRIETLMSLKDQILEQRKKRIKQQGALKTKAVNIRRITPGPAQYPAPPSCVSDAKMGKISKSSGPNLEQGSIDLMVKQSKSIPAAGTYDPKTLPDGQSLGPNGGIRLGRSKKSNFLDEIEHTRAFCPGPGQYETAKSTVDLKHGTRIVRDYITEKGLLKQDAPGPAHYAVDNFHRKMRLQKTQRSLPALQKALNMGDLGKVTF